MGLSAFVGLMFCGFLLNFCVWIFRIIYRIFTSYIYESVKILKTTMGKFRIYKKSERFVWTRSRIILAIILLILLIFGIEGFAVGEIRNNLFNKIVGYLMCFVFFAGIINNLFREELKGELDGTIIFENEKIQIGQEIFPIDEIRLIKFNGYDYVDMLITVNFPDGLFSNGVDNKLIIIFHSGKVITTAFQRNYETEMRKIIKELTHYYNEKKMIKENYLNTINERIF